MILFKYIWNRHFHVLLKLQNPCNSVSLRNPNFHELSLFPSLCWRPFSSAAPIESEFTEKASQKFKKPLSVFFKESISVSGKTDSEAEVEEQSVGKNADLIGKLKFLEEEMKGLNEVPKLDVEKSTGSVGAEQKRRSLWAVFADEKKKMEIKSVKMMNYGVENPGTHKSLSSDMQIFANLLFKEGYFKDSTLMLDKSFDPTQLEDSYARGFLKCAAVKFGGDHLEIAKWLSASDLKDLALFGCPSLGERTVYAAKRIRSFFEIEERKVCQKCTLRELCKRKNQVRESADKLKLPDITRVLVTYAMDLVPPKLVVPETIKNHVSSLLKEVINLSQTAP